MSGLGTFCCPVFSLPTIIASGATIKLVNVFSVTVLFVMARLLDKSLRISLGSPNEKLFISVSPCSISSLQIHEYLHLKKSDFEICDSLL